MPPSISISGNDTVILSSPETLTVTVLETILGVEIIQDYFTPFGPQGHRDHPGPPGPPGPEESKE